MTGWHRPGDDGIWVVTEPQPRPRLAGWHWAASIRRSPRYLNIPYAPHRILVLGWGRLAADATFRPHQPCCYRMRLDHCCPAREAQHTRPPRTPGGQP